VALSDRVESELNEACEESVEVALAGAVAEARLEAEPLEENAAEAETTADRVAFEDAVCMPSVKVGFDVTIELVEAVLRAEKVELRVVITELDFSGEVDAVRVLNDVASPDTDKEAVWLVVFDVLDVRDRELMLETVRESYDVEDCVSERREVVDEDTLAFDDLDGAPVSLALFEAPGLAEEESSELTVFDVEREGWAELVADGVLRGEGESLLWEDGDFVASGDPEEERVWMGVTEMKADVEALLDEDRELAGEAVAVARALLELETEGVTEIVKTPVLEAW
jgi:hypothetical protein